MAFRVQLIGDGADMKIQLADTSNNTLAEIYSFGALLNKFLFEYSKGTLNVIDGFESPEEARKDITPLFKSAKLTPFVCRVEQGLYEFGETEYQLQKYFMKEHAIHGLVFDQVFDVIETAEKTDYALVVLQYEYTKTTEGYPFRFRCEVSYKLHPNNKVEISTKITNIDNKLIPVTDGWHPYFTVGDYVNDCQLEFQSKEMLEFDEGLIPTGNLIPYQEFGSLKQFGPTWFDNCFSVNFAECQPMVVLRNPRLMLQVEIHPDQSYPYLQFFTPDHRRSIAIENLSAAPDAFNNGMGLHVLAPDESRVFTTRYVLKSL